jgi:hypothetical protein
VTSYRLLIYLLLAALITAGLYHFASLAAASIFAALAMLPLLPVIALRFLASIFVLIATIALISDLTPALSGTGPVAVTPLADHWTSMAPASFSALKSYFVSRGQAWIWEGPVMGVISWPTFLLFGLLAIVCGYAGRRRHEVKIYVN